MIERFKKKFLPCPENYHDFAGMFCIKTGCPEGFESCGPFCATKSYCKSLMTGVLSEVLLIVITITTVMATGGLAAANPMTIASLVGGILKIID